MAGSSNRRRNSRNPFRNRNRRNANNSNRTQSSKKKNQLNRDSDSADRMRETIALKTNRINNLDSQAMKRVSEKFRSAYSRTPLASGTVSDARSMKSDVFKLEAFRYKDNNEPKIIISNLGNITDNQFGVVDTIRGIMQKSEFDTEDGPIQVFLTVNSESETAQLREAIENADPDLLNNITFIRNIERAIPRPDETDDSNDVDDLLDEQVEIARVVPGPTSGLIDSDSLKRLMGDDPKDNVLFVTRSKRYKKVISKLDQYHEKLKNYQKDLNDKDLDDAELFNRYNRELTDITNDLGEAILDYTANTKKSKTETKKDVMQDLTDQLSLTQVQRPSGNADNPIMGLNKDLEKIRVAYWRTKFNPLDQDQIISNGRKLGTGAQGDVFSKNFRINDAGIPLDFEAGIKFDSVGTPLNGEALRSGLDPNNPEQSKRAVLSYHINKLFGMDVIPRTEFFMQPDDNGDIRFGQAIQYVSGTEGQFVRDDVLRLDPQKEKSVLDGVDQGIPIEDMSIEKKYVIKGIKDDTGDNRQVFIETPIVVDINYSNPMVQQKLSDLQLLDNIIGHADRHPGNFIFETDSERNIMGIKGIDNDESFGYLWQTSNFETRHEAQMGSKTPGVPPIIDIDTAVQILRAATQFRESLLKEYAKTLPPTDIYPLSVRFEKVRAAIIDRIKMGNIASTPGTIVSDEVLQYAAQQADIDDPARIRRQIKNWGSDEITRAHGEKDSYLGNMKARGEVEGKTLPVFK